MTTTTTTTTAATTTTTEETTTTTEETTTTTEETTTTTTEITTTTEEPVVSTTTTTEEVPVVTTTSISIEVNAEAGFYLSVDERPFNAADLLKAFSVNEDGEATDITADITFDYATPKAAFDDKNEAYCAIELTPKYNGEDVDGAAKPKVYIGIKGDAQLDGDVDMDDSFEVLQYYSYKAAGRFPTLTDGTDENLEKLAYFLADVDTESKLGKNEDEKALSMDDAFNILQFVSYRAAGRDTTWPDVVTSLKSLENSIWFEG